MFCDKLVRNVSLLAQFVGKKRRSALRAGGARKDVRFGHGAPALVEPFDVCEKVSTIQRLGFLSESKPPLRQMISTRQQILEVSDGLLEAVLDGYLGLPTQLGARNCNIGLALARVVRRQRPVHDLRF